MTSDIASEPFTNVAATIPTERIADFYRLVAGLIDGGTPVERGDRSVSTPESMRHPAAQEEYAPFTAATPEQVRAWWGGLSATAREVFSFLARNPGERFTSADLASECGVPNGVSGVAGVFGWPNRKAKQAGFFGPWDWTGREYVMDEQTAAHLSSVVMS